jgi:hypothetical protein
MPSQNYRDGACEDQPNHNGPKEINSGAVCCGFGLISRLCEAIGNGGLERRQRCIEFHIGSVFVSGQLGAHGRPWLPSQESAQSGSGRDIGRHPSSQTGCEIAVAGECQQVLQREVRLIGRA